LLLPALFPASKESKNKENEEDPAEDAASDGSRARRSGVPVTVLDCKLLDRDLAKDDVDQRVNSIIKQENGSVGD
jgi:hypothetical protein